MIKIKNCFLTMACLLILSCNGFLFEMLSEQPHDLTGAKDITKINTALNSILSTIKSRNYLPKDIKKRWSTLEPNNLKTNLTIDHLEDFFTIYEIVDNKNVKSEEINSYVLAMYIICETDVLAIDKNLSRTHQLYYRKIIAQQTFESFFLKRILFKNKNDLARQKKDIATLTTGVFCSTGFALLFASLFIWKCLR